MDEHPVSEIPPPPSESRDGPLVGVTAPETTPPSGADVAVAPAGDEQAFAGTSVPADSNPPPPDTDDGFAEPDVRRRREWLPVPAHHGWWILLVAVLSLSLYLSTACRGVFPGEPAILTALHSRTAPLPALTHPLWGVMVRLMDRGAAESLPRRLNGFSAVCGMAAVVLLFHLIARLRTGLSSAPARLRRVTVGPEWISRVSPRPGDSLLRHVPAWIAAMVLAGSFPFWFVATRAHTGAFGLALVLGGAALVARYHQTGRRSPLLAASVVLGLALAETPVALFLAPAAAVWALVALVLHDHLILPFMTDAKRGHWRVGLPIACLVTGAVAMVIPILLRAAFLLDEPAAEWADVRGYGPALLAVIRTMWMETRSLIPRLGWILLAASVAIPAFLVGGSAMGERPGRRWLPLMAYVFASVFGILLVFDVRVAPWPFFGMSPLYITPYAAIAIWMGVAAAGVLRLALRDLDRTDLPVWMAKGNLTPEVRRRIAWGYSAIVGVAVLAGGARHWTPVQGSSSDLFDAFAAGVLDESAGCEWLVSASPFESLFAVTARARGEPVRILDARMGRTPAYMRFVASSFPDDPRIRSLADAGLNAVLPDWFARSAGLTGEVAVLDLPDLWRGGGYVPVPGRFTYRGAAKVAPEVVADLAVSLGAWTNRLAVMRRQVGALPEPVRPYGRWITVHAGRLLNDTGVLCEEAGRIDDALAAYHAAAAHDPDNYSARFNRERLARAAGRPEADAYREDLETLVRRFGGRVDPAFMSRIHGRIRDARTSVARGLQAAAGGEMDIALAELVEAARISDDPATRMALAAILEGRGDVAESRTLVDGVAARDPANAAADLTRSAMALHAGELDAAEAGIARAAARPETAAAAAILSVLLEVQRGDLKAATARVVRMQSERPDDLAVLAIAAYVAWRRGDMEALAIADESLRRRNHRVPMVSVLAASAEAAQGRMREARKRLDETAARNPSYAPVWDALLRLDYVERRQDLAREHVIRILRLRPNHPLANHYLASFQIEEGRHAEAEASLRTALAGAPKDPAILNDLAWCLLMQKRPAEALPYARQAAELRPAAADVLDTLGLALMETGVLGEASQVFTRAVELAPSDAEIRGHLEELRKREAAVDAGRRSPGGGEPRRDEGAGQGRRTAPGP